jgi:2,3-bisphosphoglycerate-independent phosphoglycerate mutase
MWALSPQAAFTARLVNSLSDAFKAVLEAHPINAARREVRGMRAERAAHSLLAMALGWAGLGWAGRGWAGPPSARARASQPVCSLPPVNVCLPRCCHAGCNPESPQAGQPPANVVLLRGCGCRIRVPPFAQLHGDLKPCLVAPTKIIAGARRKAPAAFRTSSAQAGRRQPATRRDTVRL